MKKKLFPLLLSAAMAVSSITAPAVYANSASALAGSPEITTDVIDTSKTGSITVFKYESKDGQETSATGLNTGIEGMSSIPISGSEFSYVKVADIVQVTEKDTGTTGTYYRVDPDFAYLLNMILSQAYDTSTGEVKTSARENVNDAAGKNNTKKSSERGATEHALDNATGNTQGQPGQTGSMLLTPVQTMDGNAYLKADGSTASFDPMSLTADSDYVYASDDLDEAMANANRADIVPDITINGKTYTGTGEEMINSFVKQCRGTVSKSGWDYKGHKGEDAGVLNDGMNDGDARYTASDGKTKYVGTDGNGKAYEDNLELGLYVVAETRTRDHIADGYDAYDSNSVNPSADTQDESKKNVNNDGNDGGTGGKDGNAEPNDTNGHNAADNSSATDKDSDSDHTNEEDVIDDGYGNKSSDDNGPNADNGVGNINHNDDAGNSNRGEHTETNPSGNKDYTEKNEITYGTDKQHSNDGTEVTVNPCSPFFVSVPMTNITKIGNTQDAGSVWQYDIIVYPKNTRFYLRKDIVTDGNDLEDGETTNLFRKGLTMQTDKNVGDTITFVDTAEIPVLLTDSVPGRDTAKKKQYTEYTVQDHMSDGLTFLRNTVEVRIGTGNYQTADTVLTEGADYSIVETDGAITADPNTGNPTNIGGQQYTMTEGDHNFVIQLTQGGLDQINALSKDSRIFVTYKATLNSNAVKNDTGTVKMENNQCDVYLDFDNTSRQHYTSNTVYAYTYEVDLTKELSQDNNADDPQTYKDVKFSVRGLKADKTVSEGKMATEQRDTGDNFEDLYFVEEGENTGIWHVYDNVESQNEEGGINFPSDNQAGGASSKVNQTKTVYHDTYDEWKNVSLYNEDGTVYKGGEEKGQTPVHGDGTVLTQKKAAAEQGAQSWVSPNPESGKLVLKGLDARLYVLTEEETEPGYNLLKDRIYVKLEKNDPENGSLDACSIWTEGDTNHSAKGGGTTATPDKAGNRADFVTGGYQDTKGTNDATEYEAKGTGNTTNANRNQLSVMSQDVVSYNNGNSDLPQGRHESNATEAAAGNEAYKDEQAANENKAQDLTDENGGAGTKNQIMKGLKYGIVSFVIKNNEVPILLKTGGAGWKYLPYAGAGVIAVAAILMAEDKKKKKKAGKTA